jgi:hypothetical protein
MDKHVGASLTDVGEAIRLATSKVDDRIVVA